TGLVHFNPGHALEGWIAAGIPGITRTPQFDVGGSANVIDETATMQLGDNYDPFQTDEQNGFEIDPHGKAHTRFEGPIMNPATATQDPLFFMLHCNVDRLWAKWQWVKHHTNARSAGSFAPDPQQPSRPGYRLNDTMWPWNGIKTAPRPRTAPGGAFI